MADSPVPRLRVLAVDDWLDTAESLGTLIRLWGHEVRVARDGAGALREAAVFHPDVVLLDAALGGGLNGLEVARRLRADPSMAGTFLVCVSGYGTDADRQQAFAAGFDHHILKPADPLELQRLLIARHLVRQQLPPPGGGPDPSQP